MTAIICRSGCSNLANDGRLSESTKPLALPVPGDVRPQGLATF